MDKPVLKVLFDSLIQLIFPQNCAGCEHPFRGAEKILCLKCQFNLPLSKTWIHQENIVCQKLQGRFSFEKASSFLYFTKEGITQHLMHQLKYKGREDLAHLLGNLYGESLAKCQWAKDIDCIIPVPIHKRKRQERGYNQSELIASGLSISTNVTLLKNELIKIKHTSSQTRKTNKERIENVKEVFQVKNPETLIGKHILLVDDVITTGATLESCANTILEIPKTKVSIVTLAIAEN